MKTLKVHLTMVEAAESLSQVARDLTKTPEETVANLLTEFSEENRLETPLATPQPNRNLQR